MSREEHAGWVEFLGRRWDKPSRSDWYVMQLTAVLCSSPEKMRQAGEFRIKFKRLDEDNPMTPEQQAARVELSKAGWAGATKATTRRISKAEWLAEERAKGNADTTEG